VAFDRIKDQFEIFLISKMNLVVYSTIISWELPLHYAKTIENQNTLDTLFLFLFCIDTLDTL